MPLVYIMSKECVSWNEMEMAIKENANRHARLSGLSCGVLAMPADVALSWFPGWTEDTTFTVTDAVSFALWVRDPMYRIAATPIRRSMEMEEASTLLHASETAWKQHNGRLRGWVRKHLEEDLRLRAGGGEPAPNAWDSIRTTKRAALLMDYVCVMRSLRAALWWPDQKVVTVIGKGSHISQLNCLSGRMILGPSSEFQVDATSWPALLLKASADIVWVPPANAPSVGSLTVAQIQEKIAQIAPEASRSGGRQALWNRLQWLALVASLSGPEPDLHQTT